MEQEKQMTGKDLLQFRRALGSGKQRWTQEMVAREIGTTKETICRWENQPDEPIALWASKLILRIGQERGVLDAAGNLT